MELTEEQKRRIEVNRQKALAIRAARLQQQQCANQPASVPNVLGPPPAKQVKTMDLSSSTANSNQTAALPPLRATHHGSVTVPLFPPRTQGTQFCPSSSTQPIAPVPKSAIPTGVSFELCSLTHFQVTFQPFHEGVLRVLKSMPSKNYNPTTRIWSFDLMDYMKLISQLRSIEGVGLSGLPRAVLHVFQDRVKMTQQQKTGSTMLTFSNAAPVSDLLSSRIHRDFLNLLMPFQRDCVEKCVSQFQGRMLLADDMGLGKTVQSLAIAAFYRDEWPLLIVTPNSVCYTWREQVRRWLGSTLGSRTDDETAVQVLTTSRECPSPQGKLKGAESPLQILIVSYDLMRLCATNLLAHNFLVVIMDESHMLKNHSTARTKAATPIMKAARRLLLLSGTPALSRPSELFPQIDAVNPQLFQTFKEFGARYCGPKVTRWGTDYTGSSHLEELALLLEKSIMMRRLKCAVLHQLPKKLREVVLLNPNTMKGDKESANRLRMCATQMMQKNLSGFQRHTHLLTYFHETSLVKIPAIRDYLEDMLEGDQKFLFFAHHHEVLDAAEETLTRKDVEFVRISGSTSSDDRQRLCDKFQTCDSVKVALLSITAAGTGLNLTAACVVVFAELYWNPGILVQAEDRAYRIGQLQDAVLVRYLLAEGTADDYIWTLIRSKLEVLGKAGLSKDHFQTASMTRAPLKESNQLSILQFMQTQLKNDLEIDLPEVGEELSGTK